MAGSGSKSRGEGTCVRVASALRRAAPVLLSALAAAMLSGCGTISQKFSEAASQVPGIALPADAPERTSETGQYPAVHDLPPPRNTETLTAIERQLRDARTQQQTSNAAILAESADRDKKEQEMKDLKAAQAAAAAQAGR
jgi:hypothetical protein